MDNNILYNEYNKMLSEVDSRSKNNQLPICEGIDYYSYYEIPLHSGKELVDWLYEQDTQRVEC